MRHPHLAEALGLSLLALAALAQGPEPVTLRLKLQPPTVLRYAQDSKSTTLVGPASVGFGMTMIIAMKALEAPEGHFKLEYACEDPKVTADPGSPLEGKVDEMAKKLRESRVTLAYDNLGRIGPLAGANTAQLQAMTEVMAGTGMGFMGLEFPQEPAAVGSKWASSFDIQPALESQSPDLLKKGQNTKIPVEYKLDSLQTVGGRQVAGISMRIDGKLNLKIDKEKLANAVDEIQIDMKSGYQFTVDVASGVPTSVTSDLAMIMSAGEFRMKNYTRASCKLKSPLP